MAGSGQASTDGNSSPEKGIAVYTVKIDIDGFNPPPERKHIAGLFMIVLSLMGTIGMIALTAGLASSRENETNNVETYAQDD